MSRWGLLTAASPKKIGRTLRTRGVLGTAQHGARRLGALAGSAVVGPELVQINPLTYICNHACPMCWLQHADPTELRTMQRREKKEGLTLRDYVALFDGMLSGLREVMLIGGGEPLAHPDCAAIMREVKGRGWRGTLITNGSLLREEIAQALVEMRWDSTRVSVHAGDAETYRAVQGVDRFDVVRTNLRAFDRARRAAGVEKACQLIVYQVLQPANVAHIDRLLEFAEEVGADAVVFELVVAYDAAMRIDPDDLSRIADALHSCARAARIPCTLPPVASFVGTAALGKAPVPAALPAEPASFVPGKRCAVGFDQTFITSFGDVRPCCFSDEHMGNVREQSFAEIWYGPRYCEFRRRLIAGSFARYCIENRCTLASVLPY
jgi:MoaA/NifB/PqqE/SkfB family radical SAM enzyme